MKDADYYALNPEEFDDLSDDEKEAVVNGLELDGDTSPVEEINETPVVGEPELLAKDGVHQIPYQELVDARTKAAEWESFSQQQAELIKQLQAAKIEDAGTGDTKAQDAVVAEYTGDYPEVINDMKPYLQRMIDDGIKAGLQAFEAQIDKRVAPVEKFANETATDKYFRSIRDAHPDADAIVDDTKFYDWVNGQPGFIRDAYKEALEYKRPANDLIEMFTAYKSAINNKPVDALDAKDATDKAKTIVSQTQKKTPSSLSDIPSGVSGQHDEIEAMRNMTSRQLEAKFFGKSPEEVNRLVAKLI